MRSTRSACTKSCSNTGPDRGGAKASARQESERRDRNWAGARRQQKHTRKKKKDSPARSTSKYGQPSTYATMFNAMVASAAPGRQPHLTTASGRKWRTRGRKKKSRAELDGADGAPHSSSRHAQVPPPDVRHRRAPGIMYRWPLCRRRSRRELASAT